MTYENQNYIFYDIISDSNVVESIMLKFANVSFSYGIVFCWKTIKLPNFVSHHVFGIGAHNQANISCHVLYKKGNLSVARL